MVTRVASADGNPVVRRRGEAGYNLVLLMVAVTVLNILVAAAIPLWRTAIKREKEEELIFRGWQYAEGIRVFHHRFGRQPVRLEELVEVKPRCMRQLWVDPVTGKNDWVPIRVVAPGGVPPQVPPGGDQGDADGRPDTPDGNVGLGPIHGVHSRSTDKAIKRLFDQERYDQWQFVEEMLVQGRGFGVPGQVGLASRLPAVWVGRPFRPGVVPSSLQPPPNQPPNGGPPGGPPPPPPPPPPVSE